MRSPEKACAGISFLSARFVAAITRTLACIVRDAADTLKSLLLRHAKQFWLHRRWQLSDFVQKEGSTPCLLKSPDPLCCCPSKCAPLMPKELGFNQVFRNG